MSERKLTEAELKDLALTTKYRHTPLTNGNCLGCAGALYPCDAAILSDAYIAQQARLAAQNKALTAARELADAVAPMLVFEDSKRRFDPLTAADCLRRFRAADGEAG